jgi:hypothetical protein
MAHRKRIAAVVTWYTPGSHSDVLVGKFLPGRGIALDDGFHELRVELVSIYIDQVRIVCSGKRCSIVCGCARHAVSCAHDARADLSNVVRCRQSAMAAIQSTMTSGSAWPRPTASRCTRPSGRPFAASTGPAES